MKREADNAQSTSRISLWLAMLRGEHAKWNTGTIRRATIGQGRSFSTVTPRASTLTRSNCIGTEKVCLGGEKRTKGWGENSWPCLAMMNRWIWFSRATEGKLKSATTASKARHGRDVDTFDQRCSSNGELCRCS